MNRFYILTRFNAISFPKRVRYMKNNLNDDWLRRRLDLMKETTIPSVLGQTNQDFEWVVYCHPESPQWLLNEFKAIDKIRVSTSYWYQNALYLNADIIVTSRVDSDDRLHQGYMAAVQTHLEPFKASGLPRQLYVFQYGYYQSKGRIFEASSKFGPFHTLFADRNQQREDTHVYHARHEWISEVVPPVYNTSQRGWMYTKHDDNLSGCDFIVRDEVDDSILKEFGQ